MMFVTKIAAPLPSRMAALLLTSPEMMRTSNSTADSVLSMVIAAKSPQVTYLPTRVRRVIKRGLIASSARSSRPSNSSSGQRGTTV